MDETIPGEIDLVKAIGELSLRQREAVLLYYLADIPVRGVADLMRVSEGTVKAHLAHARRNLRRDLEVTDA